jgi:hypothetical protein
LAARRRAGQGRLPHSEPDSRGRPQHHRGQQVEQNDGLVATGGGSSGMTMDNASALLSQLGVPNTRSAHDFGVNV